ncbi:FAD:protein FMN transferase [Planctomycetales bacterium 10988]|nr:FAD:protein FMN transferase [Planctomycetales bacterium 10988]
MAKSKGTNRREFLRGKSAVVSLQDALDRFNASAEEDESTAKLPPATYVLEVTRRAMACDFQLLLNAGMSERETAAAVKALDKVEALEDQLTVYQETSEVSLLNKLASKRPFPVKANLFELIERSIALSKMTAGAFDITAGPLAKVWGFYRRQGQIPHTDDLQQTLERVGSQLLELDSEKQTVYFQKPGMELNFGAIGKGLALDEAAEVLKEEGVGHFLFHGGQSSMLAAGCRARGRENDPGWVVGIGHPIRRDKKMAHLRLINRGIGTSGSGVQFFRHEGKKYGHLLDPRTGQPAEGVLSVTVCAASAAEADALSTAFYVLGEEKIRTFCEAHPEVQVLLMLPTTGATSVRIETFNFEDELEILSEPIAW